MENKEITVAVQLCREEIQLPAYANLYDAGMDVCAAIDLTIYPGETHLIPTGLKVAIPIGYEIQVRPRSGLSLHTPLRVPNSPGTIDAGYRDEICVLMQNTSPLESQTQPVHPLDTRGNQPGPYKICKGDRIAQLVLCHVPKMQFEIIEDVHTIGTDRKGGFGSSGI